MSESTIHRPTYGESLLNRLLRDLPKKQFFYHYEPQIITPDGNSSKPDFIVVNALLGVVVLEVKDWVKIVSGSQQSIQTIRSDGTPMIYDNPMRIAEGYAYDLKKRFEARAELWEQYKGKTCLRFPWQCMVALPRISVDIIRQFERKGIWPRGTVLGKEQLTSAAHLQQAIENLPWKFRLEQPMSLDILDIVRELINPSLVVQDTDGFPVGTLTRAQYGLITEPLYAAQPKQLPMFEEYELSNEAMGISENAMVRLVRGVAGSGKTLVLVRRVRHVAEQHPDAKILVMAFNVDISQDLRKRINLPETTVEVLNFHKVCRVILKANWQDPISAKDWLRKYEGEALRQLGLSADFVAGEIAWRKELALFDEAEYLDTDRKGRGQRLDRAKREQINRIFNHYLEFQQTRRQRGESWYDWDDVPFLAWEALNSEHPMAGMYDAVFIDEAQDFAPSWIQVTKALLKPGGNLFICDDPSQSIFCSYTWPQKGLSVVGRSRVLRVPFRSTREISQAAHSLIEADETLRQTEERAEPDFTSYELGSGPLPALIACKDQDAEIAFVGEKLQELLDNNVAPGQIAILCHNRWHLERWADWQKRGVYVQHFEKMKGLEFAVVFIPHLQDSFPSPNDPDAVTGMRRKIFTAMTRARYRLTMSYHGMLPAPLEPLLENVWCENFIQVLP
jgi:thymidine kinase